MDKTGKEVLTCSPAEMKKMLQNPDDLNFLQTVEDETERYLKYWENGGSKEIFTEAEIAGIHKADEAVLLKKIDYDAVLESQKGKGSGRKGAEIEATDTTKNQKKFEAMKRKTKNILLGMIAVIIAAVAGVAVYKVSRVGG